MNKDFWDKLGTIGTFVSSTLIVIFTTIVTIHTNKLSNQIEEFKVAMDENKMINDLVKNISFDTTSNVKYDFALLALERYLKNTNTDGTLKDQDKEMLVGFAQSLILDRNSFTKNISEKDQYRILIPKEFLEKYDTSRLQLIQNILASKNKKAIYPNDSLEGNNQELKNIGPVSQVSDTTLSNSIGIILKKMLYIQYSNPDKFKEVEQIRQIFKDNKWLTPGMECVKGTYDNIIKYFHIEDREIANEANSLMGGKYRVIAIHNPKYENLVPKGQIEIWISNN